MSQFSDKNILRAFTYGLYAVLVTPLLFWHDLIYPFITPKVFIVMPLIGVLAAVWAVLLVRGVLPRPRWTRTTIALAVFLGVLITSALFGVDPARSFWSTQERGMGIIAFLHFSVFVLMLQSARKHVDPERYFAFSFLVSVIAAAFTFVHMADPQFFIDGQKPGVFIRPGSFLGNPTYLAGYLLPHIFIGLYLALQRFREKNWRWVVLLSTGILLDIVGTFLTQTRGALIGLFFGILVLAAYVVWREKHAAVFGIPLRKVAAGALSIALVLPIGFFLTRSAPVWQSIPGVRRLTTLTLSSPDIQPRLITLGIALQAFRERPILGFGFENFKYPFDAHYDPRLLRQGFGETYFDKPHNIVLEYLVNTGIVGLLAYLALTLVLCMQLLRRPHLRSFAPFGLALLAANFGQNFFVFDTFGSYLTFFLVIGFIAAREVPEPHDEHHHASIAHWRPRDVATAGVAGAVAALWIFANASIIYANHLQFWGFNYFVNSIPDRGLVSYEQALTAPINPYHDVMKRDFLSVLVQSYQQGLQIPGLADQITKRIVDLEEVVKRHPNDYFTQVSLADATTAFAKIDPKLLKRGEVAVAAAMVASPNRQQAYYVLARIRFFSGDASGGLEALQKAIALDPEIAMSHFYYGLMLFDTGNRELGLAELGDAERLGWKPGTVAEQYAVSKYYADVAGTYGDAGDYAKAITYYQKAVDENPSDLEFRLKLGIAYYYNGDKDAARTNIGKVLAKTDITQAPGYRAILPILKDLGW